MEPLSKFQQLQKIGEGGMGVVYRGWDPAIGRSVAIKFVRLASEGSSADIEAFAARLRREGQAAGNLSHPNIVTIYDFVEQDSLAYIVMEFVDGQSLEAWLGDCELLGPNVVLDIIRQSATALDYAHGKGVIHRDVKPSNILVRNDGMVKLVDFGLAKVAATSRLTQTGSAIGTPHYMSAEQIDSDRVDARSDQYSLAVCAYEMMTGSRPFVGASLQSLFNKILTSDPLPPRELNPTLGTEIGEVLIRALSKRPTDRFASCLAFATALDRACALTPAWRPKASSATKAGPGRGGGGVAVESPMPTPLDLNKLGANLDPWLTEAITPHSVSLPPAPPARPGPTPRVPGTLEGMSWKYVEPAAIRKQPPPLPPARPARRDDTRAPMFSRAFIGPDPSPRGRLYAAVAVILLLIAALAYVLLGRSGARTKVPPVQAPAAVSPAPAAAPQAPPEKKDVTEQPRKPKAAERSTPARPKHKNATKAVEPEPKPAQKVEDPINMINQPAVSIPPKKK
jgi:serine/threonine protein kinase